MPSKFQFLRAEATTNIIRNPSVEVNLDDWLADGSVIARTTDEARFGKYSVQVTTNGIAPFEGVHVRSFPNTSGVFYAGSTYVKGEGKIRVRVRDGFNGDETISDAFSLIPDRWIRIADVIGQTGGIVSNDLSVHIETTSIQAVTFYVDGVQLDDSKAYSTTYIDGDQAGGEWEGTYHASISIRVANERSGGRFLDLDEDGIGIYSTVAGGIGMPPLRHNLQDRALAPGVEFQSTKVLPRVINLTLFAKTNKRKNLALLHEKRQTLIDIIKPDLVAPTQHFILRYNGGRYPIDIEVLYEAGLEFEGDIRNELMNSFMMRLLSTDPFWVEDTQQSVALGFSEIVNNADYLVARINGQWQRPYTVVPNSRVYEIAQAPNGDIYVGGLFTTIDGVAANRIARYDGTTWHPVANGFNNRPIFIAPAPDGTIYIGGTFTADGPGGVALNRIARYDPATDTMTQVGAGLNNTVEYIAIHPITGDVYVGGDFDDIAGGVGFTLNYIARWDINNLTWNAIGAGPGFNDVVDAIAFSSDGSILYVGGDFTEEGNVPVVWPGTYGGVARYDPSADTFSTWGVSGYDAGGSVLAMTIGHNGFVYIGGALETMDGSTVNGIAQWNGTAWSGVGGGVNYNLPGEVFLAAVRRLTVDIDGNIVVGGDFRYAGELFIDQGVAIWNGSSWVRMDASLPTVFDLTSIYGAQVTRYGDLWLGYIQAGNAVVSAINEVDNIGSANSNPAIEVVGPGRLVWLENQTTQKTMYLDLIVHAGETVVIDLENRTVISDWSGNRLGDILPESDVADWFLAPGINTIAAFMQDDGDDTVLTMRWKPTHWSADGSVG